MYGLSLSNDSDAVECAMHYYGQRLKGPLTTKRKARLQELFSAHGEPTPVDIFRAWCSSEFTSAEDARKYLANDNVPGYDPVEDMAANSGRIEKKRAYDKAVDAGLEDTAALLRVLDGGLQKGLATTTHAYFALEDGSATPRGESEKNLWDSISRVLMGGA